MLYHLQCRSVTGLPWVRPVWHLIWIIYTWWLLLLSHVSSWYQAPYLSLYKFMFNLYVCTNDISTNSCSIYTLHLITIFKTANIILVFLQWDLLCFPRLSSRQNNEPTQPGKSFSIERERQELYILGAFLEVTLHLDAQMLRLEDSSTSEGQLALC